VRFYVLAVLIAFGGTGSGGDTAEFENFATLETVPRFPS